MKKLYIALSIFALSISYGQNKHTKNADKLFNRFEYVKAAEQYLKLEQDGKADAYVYKQLGDAYYNIFNPKDAAKWYAKAVETPQIAETYYKYAQMLKADGKYEQANKQLASFAKAAPADSRALDYNSNPNYVPSLLNKKATHIIKTAVVSSDKADFGAVLNNDNTVYFSSARNDSKKNYGWNNEPYLDLYKSTLNDNGSISEAMPVAELNSKFHDGTISVTADGEVAYFSSESFKDNAYEKIKVAKAKVSRIYLYKAVKLGDTWTNVTLLPFNSKEYSTGNPSISRDGKTLYFASDRPGSIGAEDIWRVAVNSDGSYGEPENLGASVNSEGSENFPFIADDNKTLYFSSRGKQGLGGFDVFRSDLVINEKAANLGKPVNSEKDDFGYTYNTNKNVGFFASNRNGNDDIFIANPICAIDLKTIVTNAKTGEILADAKVTILDEKANIIASETSNAAGEVNYMVECDKPYTIQASKDGFEGGTFAFAKSKKANATVDAKLQPIDVIVTPTEVVLNEIYFEFDKFNITQQGAFELDKLVQVMTANKEMVIDVKSHTDNWGDDVYNDLLSGWRANATIQYVISKGIAADRISGKGYGERQPKIACTRCTDQERALNRRSEFLIVKK